MGNFALSKTFNENVQKTPAGYPGYPGYQPSAGTNQQQGGYTQYNYGQTPQNGGYAQISPQYGQPQYGQPQYGQPQYGQPVPTPEQLNQQYSYPSAHATDMGRLTYDEVVVKSGLVLGTIAGVALLTGILTAANQSAQMAVWTIGALVGFVLAMVNVFKKQVSPALVMAYAVFEGLFLGGISGWANSMYPGIVFQAVFATMIVAGTSLVLFKTGLIRVGSKFRRVLMVALWSYLIFSVVNLLFMLFNTGAGMFGMRSGAFGLLIGLVAVIIAAMSLLADFADIQQGVESGAPKNLAWAAAFGLAVTLVWMYVEILRILLILASDN